MQPRIWLRSRLVPRLPLRPTNNPCTGGGTRLRYSAWGRGPLRGSSSPLFCRTGFCHRHNDKSHCLPSRRPTAPPGQLGGGPFGGLLLFLWYPPRFRRRGLSTVNRPDRPKQKGVPIRRSGRPFPCAPYRRLFDTLVVLAGAGIDADLVARVDKERHLHRSARVDGSSLQRVRRSGIALDAGFGVGYLHIHDGG